MDKVSYSDGTTPNICIIGAGFAGLTAGIDLKRKLGVSSFTIFDENHEVGGTWLVNNYPGCACDIPSHLYSWSFELNPEWPYTYSSNSDILEYMKKVAKKYDLYPHLKFNSQVKSLVWDEAVKKWKVVIYNKDTQKSEKFVFDIVINGPGPLRVPNYPKEFENFKGQILHSANWDSSVDLSNKVVGIVGSGASAIQIIPAIAPIVKELHCYQRKPAWVRPRPQHQIPKWIQTLFKVCPPFMWLFRLVIFIAFELFYSVFKHDSWANKVVTWETMGHLNRGISNDKSLQKQLVPDYPLGCKRVLFHNDYYSTLTLPQVELHSDRIVHVGDNKIVTENGNSAQIDVLILATGFKFQDFFDPMKIVGKDSTDLIAAWKQDRPESYLGILSSITPNHFILLGPNTSLGHNTVVFMIECQSVLIMQIIKEMMARGAKAVQPKKQIEKAYMDKLYNQMKDKVWAKGDCKAWYADAKGNVTAIWPWTCTTYWNSTRALDASAFEFN